MLHFTHIHRQHLNFFQKETLRKKANPSGLRQQPTNQQIFFPENIEPAYFPPQRQNQSPEIGNPATDPSHFSTYPPTDTRARPNHNSVPTAGTHE